MSSNGIGGVNICGDCRPTSTIWCSFEAAATFVAGAVITALLIHGGKWAYGRLGSSTPTPASSSSSSSSSSSTTTAPPRRRRHRYGQNAPPPLPIEGFSEGYELLVLKELVRRSIAATEDIAAAANESLERFRKDGRKTVIRLLDIEASYLTVEFFQKLPTEPDKGANNNTPANDRYQDNHLRRIGSNVSSYIGMVCDTLRNMIPKAVVHCQAKEAKRNLLNRFYAHVGSKEDLIMKQWEKNLYIIAIAGATNGSSLVVMSKGCCCWRYVCYCAICQEKMHVHILFRCKHVFYEDCVSECLRGSRRPRCAGHL